MSTEDRVVNLFSGPSALPVEVLQQAAKEMLNYKGLGYGVMEMSHRSAEFQTICSEAEHDIRDLLDVPSNYKILFLQGGCTGIFAATAMNFLTGNRVADYIVTGTWSEKAANEAAKYGKINWVVPKPPKYCGVPQLDSWKFSEEADYVYYCSNETIGGVEFNFIPETNGKPLVCDMSSNIMSKSVDVTKFACIIAGAQKLLGPAGVTIVVVREDFIGREIKECPSVWNFKKQVESKSALNTPPCYSIYVTGLVLKWMKKEGGVAHFEELNAKKSSLFYTTLEQSKGFYSVVVNKDSQSRMNIPFRVGGPLGNEGVEKKFVKMAKEHGFDGLNGHRSVGGCRASLYNSLSVENVQRLCHFMKEFQLQVQN